MIVLNEMGTPQLNTVHNCDALKLLGNMASKSVDCIITDPPYGLGGRKFSVGKHIGGGEYEAINEVWDHAAPINWMAECTRVLKKGGSVMCFGGRVSTYAFANEGLRLGWRLVNDITWFIPDRMPNMTGRMMTESTERILWFCPDGAGWTYNLDFAKTCNRGMNLRDMWTFGVERDNRLHAAQKPLELMERTIRLFTPPNGVVLDCFAGSGTTLVAANMHGRDYIGCDLSAEYCEIARQRIAQPYTLDMFATA